MSEQRTARPKVAIGRIAFAATGAAIVMLSALWVALPFVVSGGKGPTADEWFSTAAPYIGLLYVGAGLVLIRLSYLMR